jgi:hypothetical protein
LTAEEEDESDDDGDGDGDILLLANEFLDDDDDDNENVVKVVQLDEGVTRRSSIATDDTTPANLLDDGESILLLCAFLFIKR